MRNFVLLLVLAIAFCQAQQDLTKIKFILFEKSDIPLLIGDEISHDLSNLHSSGWVAKKNTYFLIHGWNSNINFAKNFVPDLLQDDSDCMIFGIDWSAIENWQYFEAAATSQDVGAYVGRFLLDLIADGEVDLALVHVIGHSLGAQASGEMGRELQRILGPAGALPRISGLDPAKPWFESRPGNTLSPTDAQWVDVMHTNSGDLVNGCLSFMEPLGHVDFYPNGGAHQVGCKPPDCTGSCTDGNIEDMLTGCSHGRSHEYYIESIIQSPNKFVSQNCNSYADYGTTSCSGIKTSYGHHHGKSPNEFLEFYLNTNPAYPYACNDAC